MTLIVRNLTVGYRTRRILESVSLEAPRGEFVIVIGPNGAGKTTLLKAIACLVPFSGCIEWDGRALAGFSAAARSRTLAYLPQGHVAHWPVTARDVVTMGRAPFASSLTRLPASDLEAVESALQAVDAQDFAERPITELSGGERARVMLARALAVGAPLLLADEPVASLDPAHQLSVMGILAKLAKQGRLAVAVSHDLLLAARFADRIAVLKDGRLVSAGPPSETLTEDLLRQVFNVQPLSIKAGEASIAIPWEPDGAAAKF